MMLLSYTRKRILRRPFAFLCFFLCFFASSCLILSLQASLLARQNNMDALVKESQVICEIKNRRTDRMTNTNANVSVYEVNELLDPPTAAMPEKQAWVSAYVSQVLAEGTEKTMVEGKQLTVHFLTDARANNQLRFSTQISYQPGWDETLFAERENVCIVGAGLMDSFPNGTISFMLPLEEGEQPFTLQIVGTVNGSNDVFAPWRLYAASPDDSFNIRTAQTLTFVLKDNLLLSQLHESAAQFYAPAHAEQTDTRQYALTIHDDVYLDCVAAAAKNMMLARWAMPVLSLLLMMAGALLSALLLRTRRYEYSVLLCLGQSKRFILAEGLLEALLPCLLAGLLSCRLLSAWEMGEALLLLAFLLGSFLPTFASLHQPIMKQMKVVK